MVKKGTPSQRGSSSYHPRVGSGTSDPPSASVFITLYWVENLASRNNRCRVGATRTTRRSSTGRPSRRQRARHKMVSLEKPFEAGALTSLTAGFAPGPSLVASHAERTADTSSGSRWARSGMPGA